VRVVAPHQCKNTKHVQVLRATLQALQQVGKQPDTRQHILDIGQAFQLDDGGTRASSDSKSISDESLVQVANMTKTIYIVKTIISAAKYRNSFLMIFC
jgi:hypothetical protein